MDLPSKLNLSISPQPIMLLEPPEFIVYNFVANQPITHQAIVNTPLICVDHLQGSPSGVAPTVPTPVFVNAFIDKVTVINDINYLFEVCDYLRAGGLHAALTVEPCDNACACCFLLEWQAS
jgi:hypothetical protein